jgi:hypothetical protein
MLCAACLAVLITAAPLVSADEAAAPPPEGSEYRVNAAGRVPARGLVAAWRGDGDARDRVRGVTGTLVGGVSYAPAMVGRGFRFDGADGGVSLPDADALKLGDSFTVACWVHVERFPARGGTGMILFRGDDRSGNDPYHLQVDGSERLHFMIENDERAAQVSAPISAGRFVHVAATLDRASGRLRLYENGEVVAETTSRFGPARDLDPAANPGVGIGNHGGRPASPYGYPFCGVVNELLVYDRALLPWEVRAMVEDRTDAPAIYRPGP